MNIVTIVGARPQFIKSAPVSKALRKAGHREIIIHTGQHYDQKMSRIFFEELSIPKPEVNLKIGSGTHAYQTGHMMIGIEKVLLNTKPDWVLIYGDTNSTLAGALAACKVGCRLAHIEAGMRSYNRQMPEEHNRVLADHCSDVLFCPTKNAVRNLRREGIVKGVYLVGDTMYDSTLEYARVAEKRSTILKKLGLRPKAYFLATVHRSQNTNDCKNLKEILEGFSRLNELVIFPVHPRTRKAIDSLNGGSNLKKEGSSIKMIDPVGYLDMLLLEKNAKVILTDSGGIQKEAYFLKTLCITLRTETEWPETVAAGWNVVAGPDLSRVSILAKKIVPPSRKNVFEFGDGRATQKILRLLETV